MWFSYLIYYNIILYYIYIYIIIYKAMLSIINNMDDKNILIAIALLVICVIEVVALVLGHNGTLLMAVFILVGGLVGYSFSPITDKLKKK